MNPTIKYIEIEKYNSNWPEIFESEAQKIKQALAENFITIQHIGSTAVPGLAAKPKIDIIAVVKDNSQIIQALIEAGYNYKGEWNIPFKKGYTKRGDININLHIYEQGHAKIELNLKFRDYLRDNYKARQRYTDLKYNLLEKPSSLITENSIFNGYTLAKDILIRQILDQIGYKQIRLLFCTHHYEWQEYHRIREEQLFKPINIKYDSNHPSITSSNAYNFILYKGTKIVAVAMVEFADNQLAILRSLATDQISQNQGFGKILLTQIEKWCKWQQKNVLKTHARLQAENFYRNNGYIEMEFNDVSISKDIIDLGKIL